MTMNLDSVNSNDVLVDQLKLLCLSSEKHLIIVYFLIYLQYGT